ncbi:MAG TPA: flavin reductase family protein [Isosphaeraceae bacterium]|jgi:flavin reductase (DIM6/NTAB) family NADH-FMN oxidoreductase RutF
MTIDVADAAVVEVYRTLVEVVTPRPIAWVTSSDPHGSVNLAPFSFFNAFGANPPVVVFSPIRRRDGTEKDTLLNVEATGEFVLNAAVEPLAEQVNLSSKELPHGTSEVELAGLTLRPSTRVGVPRIAEAPVSLECRVLQIIPVGDGPLSANLVLGQVVMIHVDDAILDDSGRVNPRKLRTIARLGGSDYCRTTDLFAMERPT